MVPTPNEQRNLNFAKKVRDWPKLLDDRGTQSAIQGRVDMFDLNLESSEVLLPPQPVTIRIEVNAADVELAFATRGNSLRPRIMMALIQALIAEDIDVKDPH
jgi:hypothetical protein